MNEEDLKNALLEKFKADLEAKSPRRKRISTTVYVDPEQDMKLHKLNLLTKIPIAEFIREGIDMVLKKHRAKLGDA